MLVCFPDEGQRADSLIDASHPAHISKDLICLHESFQKRKRLCLAITLYYNDPSNELHTRHAVSLQ